jgi:alpha-tubulin suppressor-like RCC1 family protein
VRTVDAGEDHTCAVLSNRKVACWGSNASGQLGDGTTRNSPIPVLVKGVDDAIAVSAGGGYTCALLSGGHAKCWGMNQSGELGNGKTTQSRVPVEVKGIEGARAIDTTYWDEENSTCVLLAGGSVKCWGGNSDGQLGSSEAADSDSSLSPVTVTGLTNATAIAGSDFERCALLATGRVKCWGNPDLYDYEPIPIKGVSDAKAISVGFGFGCAVIRGGTVRCWSVNPAASKVDGISNAKTISSSSSAACALVSGGKVRCWGDGTDGVLGNGTASGDSGIPSIWANGPVDVKGITGATSVSGGGNGNLGGHVCATIKAGGVACWGSNSSGELGNGVSGARLSPVRVVGISNATGISAGSWDTCARLANRQVKCWGLNNKGQLGNKSTSHHFRVYVESPTGAGGFEDADVSPTPVTVRLVGNATAVSFGRFHACALLDSGAVRCWGSGERGQLGTGREMYWTSRARWVKGVTNAVAVGVGGSSSCAALSSGEVKCWGGDGTVSASKVKGVANATAISIAGDGGYACALVAGGRVQCWRLKTYSLEYDVIPPEPPRMVGGISGAKAIDASSRCAIILGGSVACWSIPVGLLPVTPVGVTDAVQLGNNNCAVLSTGRVACWQKGRRAALVKGMANARAISGGYYHSCALLKNRTVECWGDNTAGQLGYGSMQAYSAVPVRVAGLS